MPEAEAVLTTLPHIFTTDALSEVSFTASLNGQPMLGTIDRLLIGPDHILAVDFKSNHRTPATAAETPEGILRQMAAYTDALRTNLPKPPDRHRNPVDPHCHPDAAAPRYCEGGYATHHYPLTRASHRA